MGARLLFHEKVVTENGEIVEIKIWSVPESRAKPEGLKYSLAYIVGGERIIGYDNAEGKGHHRHYGKAGNTYYFTTIDKLIFDFRTDVEEVNDES